MIFGLRVCQGSSPLLQRRTIEIEFEALGNMMGENLAKKSIDIGGIVSNASYEHISFFKKS